MMTWSDRLKIAIGPNGYDDCMRRSVQTVILYEAKRCVQPRLAELRPFQRKAVFMSTAVALLDSLDIMYPHQKAAIFWRTATSRELLDAEISWKRVKKIEREMSELSEKIKPFLNSRRSHDQAVDAMIQHMFVSNKSLLSALCFGSRTHVDCAILCRCCRKSLLS